MKLITKFLLISLIFHLILIYYGHWIDSNKDSNLNYTDLDYKVFTDSSKCLMMNHSGSGGSSQNNNCELAQGRFNDYFQLGNVYSRITFRYTPLLSFITLTNLLFHYDFSKLLFSMADLFIGYLLNSILIQSNPELNSSTLTKYVGFIWLLNPIIINISTRGSSESILGVLVVSTLVLAKKERWSLTALIFGLSVHFKVYPIIYGSSLLAAISRSKRKKGNHRWISSSHIQFGLISFSTFMFLNLIMFSIWGEPFLENTFLYHIKRLDHRHNFSPYFYPFYLSSSLPLTVMTPTSLWTQIIRNSLSAFVPQLGLSIAIGFILGPHDLALAWFVQTFVFVTFNKVCTSQYFLWYLWLLPPILPRLNMSRRSGIITTIIWVLGQGLWLSQAYRLEMLGESTYLLVWLAGVVFFVINCGVLMFTIHTYNIIGLKVN